MPSSETLFSSLSMTVIQVHKTLRRPQTLFGSVGLSDGFKGLNTSDHNFKHSSKLVFNISKKVPSSQSLTNEGILLLYLVIIEMTRYKWHKHSYFMRDPSFFSWNPLLCRVMNSKDTGTTVFFVVISDENFYSNFLSFLKNFKKRIQ